MKTLKLTTKRQATLPVEVCEELGVGPGDEIALERRTIDGVSVWVLHARKPDWSWLGVARKYARGRTHEWDAVEESIGRGMAGDRRP